LRRGAARARSCPPRATGATKAGGAPNWPPNPPIPRTGRGTPSRSSVLQERLELRTDYRVGERADVLAANSAVAPHEERLRHALDAVLHRELALRIRRIGEGEAEALDEGLRRLGRVLHVNADDHDTAL